MKRTIFYFSIILFSVISISSCTKVIDISLNSSTPKITIESSINDQPASCIVKISKTINYNELNDFPAVIGALVLISDNLGNTATLTESTPGIYTAKSYQGVVGRTYTLSVTIEGSTYTATSTMPSPVSIDLITQDISSQGGPGPGPGGSGLNKFVKITFHDSVGISNYYRFVEVINERVSPTIFVDNDKLRDGNIITQNLSHQDSTLHTGDNVTVLLQSIDKGVFDYFETLGQIAGGDQGPESASPANPTSNLSGGALGYFSAYAVRFKKIVIQ